ncbi:MAG: hypothetical protein V3S01_03050 [Dehalococcoidia bacterium]
MRQSARMLRGLGRWRSRLTRGRLPGAPELTVLLGLAAVFWAQFAWVQSTNFWGSDEWLHLSLTSRGIIDFPYANRPLMLLWSLPAALLVPNSLGAF